MPGKQTLDLRRAWDQTARPLHVFVAAVAIVALLLAALLTPGSDPGHVAWLGEDLEMPCTLRLIWGVPCWACGMTRAFVAGIRGDLAAAWAFNPAGLWLLAVVAAQVPYRLVRIRWPARLPGTWQPDAILVGVSAVVVLVAWIVRLLQGPDAMGP